MTIIFSLKMFKFDVDSGNGRKRDKKFVVFEIIAFESRTRNSHNREQDISLWQSMCYETLVRLNI